MVKQRHLKTDVTWFAVLKNGDPLAVRHPTFLPHSGTCCTESCGGHGQNQERSGWSSFLSGVPVSKTSSSGLKTVHPEGFKNEPSCWCTKLKFASFDTSKIRHFLSGYWKKNLLMNCSSATWEVGSLSVVRGPSTVMVPKSWPPNSQKNHGKRTSEFMKINWVSCLLKNVGTPTQNCIWTWCQWKVRAVKLNLCQHREKNHQNDGPNQPTKKNVHSTRWNTNAVSAWICLPGMTLNHTGNFEHIPMTKIYLARLFKS